MSYTEEEVKARLATLVPGATSLDKLSGTDGSEIVQSVKDLTERTLQGNVDALYYLVELAAILQRARIAETQAALLYVDRMILAANNPGHQADRTRLPDITSVFWDLTDSDRGSRTRLSTLLSRKATDFAKSSKTPAGRQQVGVGPKAARAAAAPVVDRLAVLLPLLQAGALAVDEAVENFTTVDMYGVAFSVQADIARRVMEEHADAPADDTMSDAVLDSILLDSLMQQRLTLIDPRAPKYEGAVTSTVAGPATLLGTPLPLQGSGGAVALTVDGVPGATLTAPNGAACVLSFPVPTTAFVRSDGGVHTTLGDTANKIFSFALKEDVVPTTVVVLTTLGGAPHELRDNGFGSIRLWTSFLGALSYGTINYTTGVLDLVLIAAPDSSARVAVSHDFYLVGKAAPYNVIGFIVNNTSTGLPVDLTAGPLVDITQLETELFALTSITPSIVGDSIEMTHDDLGTRARIACPEYSLPTLNTAFGLPKWTVVPNNLNEALGVVNSNIPDAFGTDVGLADMVVVGSLNIGATSELVYSGTVTTSSNIFPIPGLAVDDVLVVQSPIPATYRVASVTSTTATVAVTSGALRPVAAGFAVDASVSCLVHARRDRLQAISTANTDSSSVLVTGPGLGMTGSAAPTVTTVTLTAAPDDRYKIKPGDVLTVAATSAPIGVVSSVRGTTIGVILNGTEPLPLPTVTIWSRGGRAYADLRIPLYALRTELDSAVSGFVKLASAALVSGVALGRYQVRRADLQAALAALVAAYDTYDAYNVGSVASLLAYLRGEKMTLAASLLLGLDFSGFSALTANTLSKQSQMEDLLEAAVVEFGGANEQTEWYTNDALLSDYEERDRNDLVE